MNRKKRYWILQEERRNKKGKKMKYLKELKEGDRVQEKHLCKDEEAAVKKNGKA